jgi:serine/threonine protein kinase
MNHINKNQSVLCEGRFKIKDILGRSEHSTVYDCYDLERDERAVVKAIKLKSSDVRITERLIDAELDAISALSHEHLNVLDHYQFDQEREVLYLILEWIPGSVSLSELLWM